MTVLHQSLSASFDCDNSAQLLQGSTLSANHLIPSVENGEVYFLVSRERRFQESTVQTLQAYASTRRSTISVEKAIAIYSATWEALSLSWHRQVLLKAIPPGHNLQPHFKLQLLHIAFVVLMCELSCQVSLRQRFLDRIQRCETAELVDQVIKEFSALV